MKHILTVFFFKFWYCSILFTQLSLCFWPTVEACCPHSGTVSSFSSLTLLVSDRKGNQPLKSTATTIPKSLTSLTWSKWKQMDQLNNSKCCVCCVYDVVLVTLPVHFVVLCFTDIIVCVCSGPTLKLKRPVVSNMYKETIASLYAESKPE